MSRLSQLVGCRCLEMGGAPPENACHTQCERLGLTAKLPSMHEAIHRWENEGGALPPTAPNERWVGIAPASGGPTDGTEL
jgi:hypothetical protein